ncbi:MAG: flagellar biosynthetic protein FlhB [Gammaproteobacteria bacterium]|jgi:flagellar biosynthetic protein FlhB
MADSPTGQERTEEPTPKKRDDALKKGDVARSRELTTAMMLFAGATGFYMTAGHIFSGLIGVMGDGFSLTRAQIFDPSHPYNATLSAGLTGLLSIAPLLVVLTVVAIAAPVAIGGWAFSGSAIGFKWNRLDPIAGIKKVFGARGIIETFKALAKFTLILGFALSALRHHFDAVSRLGMHDIDVALPEAGIIVLQIFLVASIATLVVATIDVPYQLWEHTRKLRMTMQEVKDETKQQEGSPELRGRIRNMQHELANRRMMEQVPRADVVITNPSHYSVALRFDPDTMSAPRVVAKGADQVAIRIREIAHASGIAILSAPPLARSIYHTTKLNRDIPAGLYVAVAEVLAYVFQLRRKSELPTDRLFDELPIPAELQY